MICRTGPVAREPFANLTLADERVRSSKYESEYSGAHSVTTAVSTEVVNAAAAMAEVWQILPSYAYSLESVPEQRSLLSCNCSALLFSATSMAHLTSRENSLRSRSQYSRSVRITALAGT